jgi:predicted extracellular nuclease
MRKNLQLPFALTLFLTAVACAPDGHAQCVSLTSIGNAYTQNFDTLSNVAGSNTNNLTIPGWFLTESGGGPRDNEQYAVDTGSSNTGDTYSYGAAGSTERALGALRSGTLIPLFGACFTNNTGAPIVSLSIAYTGEQWRLGTAGRTDQINFEYSTNATDLNTGTWTGAAALNFVSPFTTTVGARDGNAAGNRTALSSSVTLSIASGATFWIRWTDFDATGADDGLAVDDFSLTPLGTGAPSGTGTASPSPVAAGSTTALTATITPGVSPPSTGIVVNCNLTAIGGSAAFNLPNTTGNTYVASYAVPAITLANTYSLPCTVTDDQSRSGNFNISLVVTSSSTPPSATGTAAPNPVTAGNSVSLSATPVSGANPPSVSYTLACNLTAIGGGAAVALPTNYLVPANTTAATYSLPCTVTDDVPRSSGFNISLTVQAPPPGFHTISEINGPGLASPLGGLTVITRGVVIAVRAATSSVRGFYIESQASDRDNDVNTSEGLLIFLGNTAPPPCVVVGNLIQIDGTVSNFVSSTSPVGSLPLTELTSPANCLVLSTNQLANLPAAVTIDAGNPLVVGGAAAQSRKWLGMRVSVPNAVVVGASDGNLTEAAAQAAPDGEFFITIPGVTRPVHNVAGILDTRRPSAAAATVPVWNGNPESLRVNVTGLSPAANPYEVTNGATVTGLSGVMDYNTGQGQFQLYTDAAGAGTPSPLTPTLSATPVPAALPGDLTIGNFNMERFYNDLAEGNGAVTLTTQAYQGRLNKASMAVRNVMRMPDIIGLEEVEGQRNSQGSQPVHVIDDIVNKVNADAVVAGQENPNYTYCIGLTNDPSAITPAIIYKPARVQVTECRQYGLATQYNEPGGTTNLLNDRPPMTIRANVTAAGSDSSIPIRVVVNHLRSLSGIDEPGTTNGDRVRSKRNDQAKYLANLINGTGGEQSTNWNTTDNLIVVGDFNAFFVNDGYADMMNCIAGNPAPADQQFFTAAQLAAGSPCTPILNPPLTNLTSQNPATFYSYSFAGTIQTLDHVLLNTKALSRYRQLVYARNDADFPEGPTYRNNFNRPERVSDHDMPVLYLRLPVEVTSRTRLNASAVVQNRATGRFTSNISVTNTGTAPLTGPVYVFFSNLTPGVTLPDLPVYNGQPYATVNLSGGLAAGATSSTLTISFANPSNARIGYTTGRFDGSF